MSLKDLFTGKKAAIEAEIPVIEETVKAEAAKIETVIISVEKQALDEVKAVEASVTAAISKFERLIPQLTAEIASKNSALSAAQDALARLKAMVSPPAVQAAPSAPVVPVAPVQPVADQVVVG